MADSLDIIFDRAHNAHNDASDPLDALFDEVHLNLTPGTENQQNSLFGRALGGAAHLGAGAVEGTLGTLGLAADAVELMSNPGAAALNYLLDRPSSSHQMAKLSEAVLPEKDSKYRYERTIGEFLGPGGALKGAQLLRGARGALTGAPALLGGKEAQVSNLFGALGAQAGEDLTDSETGRLVGGVFGGVAPSVLSNAGSLLRSVFRGATPQEIKGSAALAQQELTDLSADDLRNALARRPPDKLGDLMSTAEITDNAGVAQIEKTLATADEPARIYAQRAAARNAARESLLDELSKTEAVNRESLGAGLMGKAESVMDEMNAQAEALWRNVPRNTPIDVTNNVDALSKILTERQAGLPLGSRVRLLVDQFMDVGDETGKGLMSGQLTRTSGALQDIRQDALKLQREANLDPFEARVLNQLREQIDEAMGRGLNTADLEQWQAAREATRARAETFAPGTAGGTLTGARGADVRPANALQRAFKGDSRSAEELQSLLQGDPGLMEDVKRGILEMIPRDAHGNLTPARFRKFTKANEGALESLYGRQGVRAINRVAEDLLSEARVGSELAYRASKGNSVTSQRQTVAGAIDSEIADSLMPGAGGPLTRVANELRRAAAIKDDKAVKKLLFDAALDPEFALELALTPTRERVLSVMQRLTRSLTDAGIAGGRAALLEQGGISDAREVNQDFLEGTGRQALDAIQPRDPQLTQPTSPEGMGSGYRSRPGQLRSTNQLGAANREHLSIDTTRTGSADSRIPGTSRRPTSTSPSPTRKPTQESRRQLLPSSSSTVKSLDPLTQAQIQVESSGRADAVSPKGAQGLMQLMPATGREWHKKLGLPGNYDPFNPEQNVQIGTAYREHLVNRYGDLGLGLAAYNWGLGNVDRALRATGGSSVQDISHKMPDETKRYVAKVFELLQS